MVNSALEQVGVQAIIRDLDKYLLGAKKIEQANLSMGESAVSAAAKGGQLIATAAKLAAVGGAIAVGLGGVAVVAAGKFETIMARVDALTNTTAEDTDKLSKGILALSKTLPKSPAELGEAAYFALSSGITDVGTALDVVSTSAKISSAGLGETKQIVDVLTSVMNAYGKENISAAKAGDILVATVREGKGEAQDFASVIGGVIPIAAALGIKFEEVSALLASITNTGDNAAEAVTKVRGILNQIASPSDQAKKALAETGAFQSKTTKEIVKATASVEDVTKAQGDYKEASDALNLSQRSLSETTKKYGARSIEAQRAQLGYERATNNLRDAQVALNKVQGASRDTVVDSVDAFGGLRDEIQNKGLIPSLFKLRDAFAGNIEGLSQLFPDVRGFIGFLSAIESQGPQTAAILKRIQESAGITDEAFQRMTKTFEFQKGVLFNQLNVALVMLGSKLLPSVTRGIQSLLKEITEGAPKVANLAHLFEVGFGGGTVIGKSPLETQLFNLGKVGREVFDFFKTNKITIQGEASVFLDGVVTTFNALKTGADYIISNQTTLVIAIAAIALALTAFNPIGAAMVATGGIVYAIGLLGKNIDGLSAPLLRQRAAIDKFALSLLDLDQTISTLGFNKLLGLFGRDVSGLPFQGSIDKYKRDLADVNAQLHGLDESAAAAARGEEALAIAQGDAARSGVDVETSLRNQIQAWIVLGPPIGAAAGDLGRLVDAYDSLKGKQGAALEDFPALREGFVGIKTDAGPDGAAGSIDTMRDSLGKVPQTNAGLSGTAGVIAQIGAQASTAAGKVGNLLSKLARLAVGGLGTMPSVPHASGGIFSTPHVGLVAEAGPEAIIPFNQPARARQIMAQLPPSLVNQTSAPQNVFAPNIIVTGETLEAMERAAMRAVHQAFREARSTAQRGGALLSGGIG